MKQMIDSHKKRSLSVPAGIRLRPLGGRSPGFTLVEVMVSSVLLSLVILSALAMYVQVTKSSQLVRRRTDATSIAWSRIERARNLQFDEVDELIEDEGTRVNESGIPDENGKFLRRTIISTETNALVVKRIRIEILTEGISSKAFDGVAEVLETLITDVPTNGEIN